MPERSRAHPYPYRSARGYRALLGRRVVSFVVAGGTVLVLALDNGGYGAETRGTFGLLVWAVIALGFAFGGLPRGRPGPGAWVALGALAGLAAWTAVALTWTESGGRTFDEIARV